MQSVGSEAKAGILGWALPYETVRQLQPSKARRGTFPCRLIRRCYVPTQQRPDEVFEVYVDCFLANTADEAAVACTGLRALLAILEARACLSSGLHAAGARSAWTTTDKAKPITFPRCLPLESGRENVTRSCASPGRRRRALPLQDGQVQRLRLPHLPCLPSTSVRMRRSSAHCWRCSMSELR